MRTAGIVLIRQRPGKGNAIFVTQEDETGITNVLIWARLFETLRLPVMASRLMLVHGEVQRSREGVVHLMATMWRLHAGAGRPLLRQHGGAHPVHRGRPSP